VTVFVHLYSQSNPVEMTGVRSTYTKDGLYCVMFDGGCKVWKFPLQHIFRIIELSPPK
jgi:hypothetical protein